MTEKTKRDAPLDLRDRRFGGLLLIGVGLLVLVGNSTQSALLGTLLLPGMGILFLVWAFYTHRFGFAVPGCILTGLGAGILLVSHVPSLAGQPGGGVVLLGLAAGFAGITLVSPFFGENRHWWGLVPAGVLALIAALLLIGGDALRGLELLGYLWPLILVAVGLYILFGTRFRHQ
jgi:hypothetical protein